MADQEPGNVGGLFDEIAKTPTKRSTYDGWLSRAAGKASTTEQTHVDSAFIPTDSESLTRAERLKIDRIF